MLKKMALCQQIQTPNIVAIILCKEQNKQW